MSTRELFDNRSWLLASRIQDMENTVWATQAARESDARTVAALLHKLKARSWLAKLSRSAKKPVWMAVCLVP